jgi:hypothetical protein
MEALLPYLILAVSIAANLFLFLSLKKELHRLQIRHQDLAHQFQTSQEKEEVVVEPAPAPARAGFNLNTRVQAMRLWRQGEPAERIASRLGVPCREVELLIRVRGFPVEGATARPH